MIIRYMGNSVLHEKLKISGLDVISIHRHEENIATISILIFENIAIPKK